jgi:hypothetical protein
VRLLQCSIVAALFYAYSALSPIFESIRLYFFVYLDRNFALLSDFIPWLDEFYRGISSSFPASFAYFDLLLEGVLPSSCLLSTLEHPFIALFPKQHCSSAYYAPF